jgi:integrase
LPSDKLTELGLRKAKPSSKPKKFSDGGGLFLLLHPSGSKYWRMKYRFIGKEKLLAFGVWPEVSLTEARKKRNEAKQLLKSGKDPSAANKNLKVSQKVAQSNTFGSVTEEWLEIKQKEWKSPYFDDVKRSIEIHLLPDLGQRPIEDITSSEILSVLKKIEEQGKLEVASRSRQKCGAIFTYANLRQLCTSNPVSNLKGALASPKKKKFNSLSPKDLPQFLVKLEEYDGAIITKLALRFVLLTFARTIEIRFANWNEFDLEDEEPIWRIPEEKMKMGREHVVPLSSQALVVLKEVRRFTQGDKYVFHQLNNPNKPMSENTMLYAMYRMGYHSRATVHGLRATMSTLLNEKGHNPDVIEHLLSHQDSNKVRAAYNRAEYLSERRITLQWLADHLDSLYTKAQLREAITLKNEAFKREEKTLYDSTKDFLTTKIYLE